MLSPLRARRRPNSRCCPLKGAEAVVRCIAVLVGLWVLGVGSQAIGAVLGDEPLPQRRERLRQMPAGQFDAVRRNHLQFRSLSAQEREQLRRLYLQIQQHPQGVQLQQVMRSYHQWVRTLSPAARDELLKMPPAQRMEKVRELRRRAQERPLPRPEPQEPPRIPRLRGPRQRQDAATILEWLEERIQPSLSEEQRQQLQAAQGPARERLVIEHARQQGVFAGRQRDEKDPEKLRELIGRLSPEAQKWLEGPPTARRRRLQGLLRTVAAHYAPPPKLPRVAPEELNRFFAEELSDEERESLQELTPRQFGRQLRIRYFDFHPEKAQASEDAPAPHPPGEPPLTP